jgi:hypothetical protein
MNNLPSYTATEFARIKKCSRNTVYRNAKLFTWKTPPGGSVEKIVWDEKASSWQPNIKMKRKQK